MPLRQPRLPPHHAGAEEVKDWGADALRLQLQPLLPGLSVEVLPTVASTNTLLLDRARAGDTAACLLVAEEQTRGRGRMGRTWHSRAGSSLTFSLALPMAPADWSGLSLAVGLALAEALDPLIAKPAEPDEAGSAGSAGSGAAPPRIGLKWPNDLWLLDGRAALLEGRKLGGVLIETVGAGAGAQRVAVVGVGLNVLAQPAAGYRHEDSQERSHERSHESSHESSEGSREDYSQGYASLQEIDAGLTPPQVLARVAAPLLLALLRFQAHGFAPLVAAYARRDVLRGRPVSTTQPGLPNAVTHGLAEGVDLQGALRVRQGGLHRVVSGEVSARPRPLVEA